MQFTLDLWFIWLVSVSFVLVMEMYVNAFEGEENET